MLNDNYEIEAAVIGLLFQYEGLNSKINLLSEDDFSCEAFKKFYVLFKNTYDEYSCIDNAMVLNRISVEEAKLLVSCAELAINQSLIDDYIKTLKKSARQHRLSRAVEGLVFAQNCTLENLQKVIDDESQNKLNFGAKQSANENYENYLANVGRKRQLIKTGFGSVDFKIKGLEKGTLMIIGARPSTGKTTFALNIASNQVKAGYKVMFYSLEMTAEMIFNRYVANLLSLDYSDINNSKIDDNDIAEVKKEIDSLKQQDRFYVIDDVYAIENICSQITETKPDVVVIDFIQTVSTLAPYPDLRQKINYISAELKRVSKKTGCIVIALSQITRSGKDAPTMSDLMESGALEQDGDYIIIMHRPYVSNKQLVDDSTTDVVIDKNKFGWTGKLNFRFDGKHQRFTQTYDDGTAMSGYLTEDDDLEF